MHFHLIDKKVIENKDVNECKMKFYKWKIWKLQDNTFRTGQMMQWVKVLAIKPDDLTNTPE